MARRTCSRVPAQTGDLKRLVGASSHCYSSTQILLQFCEVPENLIGASFAPQFIGLPSSFCVGTAALCMPRCGSPITGLGDEKNCPKVTCVYI